MPLPVRLDRRFFADAGAGLSCRCRCLSDSTGESGAGFLDSIGDSNGIRDCDQKSNFSP